MMCPQSTSVFNITSEIAIAVLEGFDQAIIISLLTITKDKSNHEIGKV